MQRSNCTVRLGGDITNTVFKTGVSPAEIVILRHVHGGPEAVVDIQPTEMDKTPHGQERDRLEAIYGKAVIAHCFPGSIPRLPVTLKEIETGGGGDEEEADDEVHINVPEVAAIDELSEDDLELIETIKTATNKNALAALARENEVNTSHLPDKLEPMKKALLKALFPALED